MFSVEVQGWLQETLFLNFCSELKVIISFNELDTNASQVPCSWLLYIYQYTIILLSQNRVACRDLKCAWPYLLETLSLTIQKIHQTQFSLTFFDSKSIAQLSGYFPCNQDFTICILFAIWCWPCDLCRAVVPRPGLLSLVASNYDVNDQWLSPRRSHKKLTPAELQWLPSTSCLCLGILLQSADVQGQCTVGEWLRWELGRAHHAGAGLLGGYLGLWWISSFARFLPHSCIASTPDH